MRDVWRSLLWQLFSHCFSTNRDGATEAVTRGSAAGMSNKSPENKWISLNKLLSDYRLLLLPFSWEVKFMSKWRRLQIYCFIVSLTVIICIFTRLTHSNLEMQRCVWSVMLMRRKWRTPYLSSRHWGYIQLPSSLDHRPLRNHGGRLHHWPIQCSCKLYRPLVVLLVLRLRMSCILGWICVCLQFNRRDWSPNDAKSLWNCRLVTQSHHRHHALLYELRHSDFRHGMHVPGKCSCQKEKKIVYNLCSQRSRKWQWYCLWIKSFTWHQ